MTRPDSTPSPGDGTVVGPLRADAVPRLLARRLQPGDIAVIDVLDLDRTSAEALAQRRPAAVLNVQASISGRYPAGGALVLAKAGIPLLDEVDSAILTMREGTVAVIDVGAAEPSAGTAQAIMGRGNGARSKPKASTAQKPVRVAPADDAAPTTPEASATESPRVNPLASWWRQRVAARTTRKRESLTWLDDLRRTDADSDVEGASAGDAENVAITEAKGASRAASNASGIAQPGAPSEAPAPRPATVEAGGLEFVGLLMDENAIREALRRAESGMSTQLAVFTANAMAVLDNAGGVFLEGEGLPEVGIEFRDRHVLVVASGFGASRSLRSVRHYVRDHKPVVIAVSEGADIARAARIQPTVIVGATSGVSDASLKAARAIVAHDSARASMEAGTAKLGALGREHVSSDLGLASEDLAILMARAGGAKSIVTVGVEATLLDFLERGRVDAASTFLTRLGAGALLIDANTLAVVYRPRWSGVVVFAGWVLAVVALVAALWANADSRAWIHDVLTAAGVGS